MLTQQDLDRISELANSIEDHLNDLDSTSLSDLLDEVQSLQSDATELRGLVDDIELEDSDLGELIPEDLSAGEAESLKEAVNKWRTENGYPAK
jgi:archaellum component FlaC